MNWFRYNQTNMNSEYTTRNFHRMLVICENIRIYFSMKCFGIQLYFIFVFIFINLTDASIHHFCSIWLYVIFGRKQSKLRSYQRTKDVCWRPTIIVLLIFVFESVLVSLLNSFVQRRLKHLIDHFRPRRCISDSF